MALERNFERERTIATHFLILMWVPQYNSSFLCYILPVLHWLTLALTICKSLILWSEILDVVLSARIKFQRLVNIIKWHFVILSAWLHWYINTEADDKSWKLSSTWFPVFICGALPVDIQTTIPEDGKIYMYFPDTKNQLRHTIHPPDRYFCFWHAKYQAAIKRWRLVLRCCGFVCLSWQLVSHLFSRLISFASLGSGVKISESVRQKMSYCVELRRGLYLYNSRSMFLVVYLPPSRCYSTRTYLQKQAGPGINPAQCCDSFMTQIS